VGQSDVGGMAAARSGLPSSFEGLPPQQVEVAKRIVKEIEAREGRPVADISRDKIEEYIKLVSERLQSLARRQFVVGQINGVALLDRLRLVK
jgi:hypothetical protein